MRNATNKLIRKEIGLSELAAKVREKMNCEWDELSWKATGRRGEAALVCDIIIPAHIKVP